SPNSPNSLNSFTTSKFDLTLSVFNTGDSLKFNFEYCTKLFKEETIIRFVAYFKKIFQTLSAEPGQKISEIEIITEQERKQILYEFNDTATDYQRDKTIHQLVEEQVEKTPNRISAVSSRHLQVDYNLHITYRELNRNANQQAGLLRAKGTGKDNTVGILMERSLSMITSILAVWKAGSAYIPLDPHTPARRTAGVLEDSGTTILISQPQHITPLLEETYTHTVVFPGKHDPVTPGGVSPVTPGGVSPVTPGGATGTAPHIDTFNPGNPLIKINMQDLAYVIYTSGSTGKPKGAMVEHLGMQNHMQAKVRDLNLTGKSIVAQNASHTFDISVWQFFVALINGGKTVIFDNDLVLNPAQFLAEIIKEKITILELVPSYLSVILEEIETAPPGLPVEYLLVTGEEVKVNLVNRWFHKYPQIKMVNAYGPTEASDDITHYIMDKPLPADLQRVPIGKPLQNLDIYIVDKYMNLLPIGIKGELCVSGDGVGRGYLNRPELTAD
ncbi:MAG: AMP-binding protein, partial [bacterium]|nr:AMP-binding protein [bacterium]